MSVNFANAVITARDAVVKLLLDVGGARMDIKNKVGILHVRYGNGLRI